ncbi:MAG: hypothetical protein LKJ88_07040 [Bacilli bacterium]|nr:hypothetical protein [Bacilli bacterium]
MENEKSADQKAVEEQTDTTQKECSFSYKKQDSLKCFPKYFFLRHYFLLIIGLVLAVIGGLCFLPGFASKDPSWQSAVSVFIFSAVIFILYFALLIRDRSMVRRSLIGTPDTASVVLSSKNHLTIQINGKTAFENVVEGEEGYSLVKDKEWYFITIRKLYYMPIPRNEITKAVLLASGISGKKL